MLTYHPKALEYVDGLAVHYYTDKFVPPAIFDAVTLTHPEKFILATEACEGIYDKVVKDILDCASITSQLPQHQSFCSYYNIGRPRFG